MGRWPEPEQMRGEKYAPVVVINGFMENPY